LEAVWRHVAYKTAGGVPRPESLGDSWVLHFPAECGNRERTIAAKQPHVSKAGANVLYVVRILVFMSIIAACVCVRLNVQFSGRGCPKKTHPKLAIVGTIITSRGWKRLRRLLFSTEPP
jgi:hypothetical protein